jgi:aryl-alcohol dehydrogenase-like predicted oxidoreductase
MTLHSSLRLNPLGGTGIMVSCLGFGTVKIGRNEGVKYPAGFTLPDDQRVKSLLHQCQESGINLIDTAPAYGNSEERLGRLLPNRKDWVICTKVGEEFTHGESSFDFSARHIRHSIERSLQRLRSDYLDIVLVHSDGRDEGIIRHTDCLETLRRCREEGLIRAFGVSTKTVAGGLLAVQESDLVMVTYNPVMPADGEVIDLANTLGKGVLIKKALNSGHAFSHSITDTQTPDTINPVRDSLAFIFTRPGVSAVIVGTITPAHLQANIAAAIATCRWPC